MSFYDRYLGRVFWGLMLVTVLCTPGMAEAPAHANAPAFLSARELPPDASATPPERWSTQENVLWKTDLPGLGWSSPVVWNGRVYLTTCVNTGSTTPPRKGLYIEDLDANKYPPDKNVHQWKVFCLDLATGRLLWEHVAHEGVPPKPHHLKNTLASESPVTDGQRLYAYFGNIGLYCYDLDGQVLWTRPFEVHETQLGWGTAISPVVHDGRVYIVNDNEEQSYLLALDAATGKDVWRVQREEKTNYATPCIWQNEQRTELVTSGIGYARSYDLQGNLLWQIKGRSVLAIPTPLVRFGRLYLTAGHVLWGDNPFYCVKPGATGDLTPPAEGKGPASPHLLWHLSKAGPYHPTPLIVDRQIYVLYDRGLMASYHADTGQEIYPRKRIPEGRAFTSSPWTYGGKIFCLNEDGVTFAIRTGPEFEVLFTNALAEDDMCMASPVVLGDRLLIRSSARLYCIGAAARAASAGGQ